SLTILATALVDTGSRMDDVVYEEFKGTGNMEVHLDRRLAERRIFPAIDLYRSGTRREELLLNREELECAILIRKMMSGGDNIDATENLVEKIISTSNNSDLYKIIKLENMQFEKFGYKRVGK
ncbi:MAG: transcription termination factor Rho, partial [Bacillota bacterium]